MVKVIIRNFLRRFYGRSDHERNNWHKPLVCTLQKRKAVFNKLISFYKINKKAIIAFFLGRRLCVFLHLNAQENIYSFSTL